MKTLVNASNRAPVVKDYLLKDPERWQWSVDWLRSKMKNTGYASLLVLLIFIQQSFDLHTPYMTSSKFLSFLTPCPCPQLGLFYSTGFTSWQTILPLSVNVIYGSLTKNFII